VLEPLSQKIIAGELGEGHRIAVDRDGDRLGFRAARRAAA